MVIVLCLCVVVVGPRYIEDDLIVRYVGRLEHDASGVVGKLNWLDRQTSQRKPMAKHQV